MNKFLFDYTQTEHDAIILKDMLIEKLQEFNTYEEMHNYIKDSIKGFWQDVYNRVAEQFNVKYFRDVNNMYWYVEYFDFIADRDFAKEMNKGLKTKNRKYADFEKFFNKYKNNKVA